MINFLRESNVVENVANYLNHQWQTLHEIFGAGGGGGGGGGIFNMYIFGVSLRYANLSNIMLGISNSLLDILL